MSTEEPNAPAWQPLGTTERRVFGVLVEKAKTTPDAYPLTVNGITTGANQKSNRSPLMQLEPIDVENALENLRRLGAVSEVQGSGRMPKYRHRVYEWLGVDKVEAAVMTELLLRGEQTIGELRGRAARMEKIADVSALRPLLASLVEKGLVQALSPEGRGQMVTHCLYLPEQQEKLKRTHGEGAFALAGDVPAAAPLSESDRPAADFALQDQASVQSANSSLSSERGSEAGQQKIAEMQVEIDLLRETVADLEKRLSQLEQLIQ